MADNTYPAQISRNDDQNSPSNPIYTQEAGAVEVVTKVADLKQVAALASLATDNHDYTVVGTKFRLKGILFASSGSAKFEIQVGPTATLVSKAVGFTSAQTRNGFIPFDPPIEIVSTQKVRVIAKNLQTGSGSANDVYSTILGEDVA